MISKLEIKNFKSIKHIELSPKKVNLFIGEPNSGKSNILEALGLFSALFYGNIQDFIRIQNMSNIFYDNNISSKIEIKADDILIKISFKQNKFRAEFYKNNIQGFVINYDYFGNSKFKPPTTFFRNNKFRFYKYKPIDNFDNEFLEYLLPPNGKNLLNLLLTREKFKKLVNEIFLKNGLRIMFKPHEKKIEIVKYENDILISYPFTLVSDTLRRFIFYLIAVLSNKSSILIFEEPETHSFPQFIKRLAEIIALDESNQYFISTHNPYLLFSLIEKTLKTELNVYLTYYKDYMTKIKLLTQEEIQKIIDFEIDPFFNVDKYLGTD